MYFERKMEAVWKSAFTGGGIGPSKGPLGPPGPCLFFRINGPLTGPVVVVVVVAVAEFVGVVEAPPAIRTVLI